MTWTMHDWGVVSVVVGWIFWGGQWFAGPFRLPLGVVAFGLFILSFMPHIFDKGNCYLWRKAKATGATRA